jgi:hypothetical protein
MFFSAELLSRRDSGFGLLWSVVIIVQSRHRLTMDVCYIGLPLLSAPSRPSRSFLSVMFSLLTLLDSAKRSRILLSH